MRSFQTTIRNARLKGNITIEELCSKVTIDEQKYLQFEACEYYFSIPVLDSICEYLKLELKVTATLIKPDYFELFKTKTTRRSNRSLETK